MAGNTMFHPGQFVFISMQPLGKDLGHPSDKGPISYANQLGLGGYHLITKVSNEINSDNQFETTINCLWDNSGDGESRLNAGTKATAIECAEKTDISGEAGGHTDAAAGKVVEDMT